MAYIKLIKHIPLIKQRNFNVPLSCVFFGMKFNQYSNIEKCLEGFTKVTWKRFG